MRGPFGPGLARTLLRLAQTARDFVERHPNGHLLAGNEFLHVTAPLLGARGDFEVVLGKTRDIVRLDPRRHPTLLGIAAHAEQAPSRDSVQLHRLRKTQRPRIALHGNLKVARRGAGQTEPRQFLLKIGEVNGPRLANDRAGYRGYEAGQEKQGDPQNHGGTIVPSGGKTTANRL